MLIGQSAVREQYHIEMYVPLFNKQNTIWNIEDTWFTEIMMKFIREFLISVPELKN